MSMDLAHRRTSLLILAVAACTGDPADTEAGDSTSAATSAATSSPTTAVDPTEGSAPGTSSGAVDSAETSEASSTGAPAEEFVKVQLLAFNDLHGNLEPPQGSAGTIKLPDETTVDTGGAAHLAARVAALRGDNPNTIVVSAGDLIGASPLMSALFHDEPTIEVMNQIGLAYNAVGNHEFDDGAAELLRMQQGGCHTDGCGDGTPFPGASFQFLAANVLTAEDPVETLFPGYAVHEVGGVRVGFIGMTLEGTPSIVTPAGIEGLVFADEAERANALVPELVDMGVEAIVVLIHEGGYQTGYYDECPEISGPIVEIVEALDDAIDVVVSGHTHQAYNCTIDGRLVTSAASFGRVLTDIDLEISTTTGDVTAASASNVLVTRDEIDADVESFVATYKDLAAPLANTPIGSITATLERWAPMMLPGLSTMGAVIADAQLAATADTMLGGAQIALMNPGGVRADLVFEAAPEEAEDGIVTYGEAFTVQPFGNSLVVLTLTGAQIDALLEQQWKEGADPKILHVSNGFTYTYSEGAPIGDKVDPASISLDGAAVMPDAGYRVTVNSFMASGGDGFSVLVEGTERLGGANDLDALAAYFAAASPVEPPALDRIKVVP
ncbi:MAG: bifunctional metallophosphatase/5'-nucleotidase [Myxococcales bacterium]|nr:bifunctional metallophosphatase/5'-nucleotidase [Myxococcales bacterium]